MEPVRIRVRRILDFGTMVGILGIDLASRKSVVVHIDHRPLPTLFDMWRAAGLLSPLTYKAEMLTLTLEIKPDSDGGGETTDADLQSELLPAA